MASLLEQAGPSPELIAQSATTAERLYQRARKTGTDFWQYAKENESTSSVKVLEWEVVYSRDLGKLATMRRAVPISDWLTKQTAMDDCTAAEVSLMAGQIEALVRGRDNAEVMGTIGVTAALSEAADG